MAKKIRRFSEKAKKRYKYHNRLYSFNSFIPKPSKPSLKISEQFGGKTRRMSLRSDGPLSTSELSHSSVRYHCCTR
jgi:hypothetical protein